MHNLQKVRNQRSKIFVGILIFLVFSKSRIQYLWQGEISVFKVPVSIKVVPVKNDYFLYQKFQLDRYQHMPGFSIGAVLTEKKYGAYICHELIVRLMPTRIWYNLLTVSQFWSSNHRLSSLKFICLK